MCECIGMARTFDELAGLHKSIPPSVHHPRCEHYKTSSYAVISYGGQGGLITAPNMVEEFIKDEVSSGNDADDYTVTEINLTKDQFENLPEFSGF